MLKPIQQLAALGISLFLIVLPASSIAVNSTSDTAANQPVTADEQAAAVRWVMLQGAQSAIHNLGQENGIYSDPRYRIPMPEPYRKAEKILRRMGGGKYADAFILSLNRTVENTLAEGGPLIINMIDEVPIENSQQLVGGANGSIGNYFHSRAGKILLSQFSPIIARHADKAGLISSMNTMLEKARFIRALNKASLELEKMIWEMIINFLAAAILTEEIRIKGNPALANIELIEKVFSEAI